jgi:hypothetical protein
MSVLFNTNCRFGPDSNLFIGHLLRLFQPVDATMI